MLYKSKANAMLQGKQYWADERRLCKVLLDAQASHVQEAGFDLHDVHTTSEGKSFDYRVGAEAFPVVIQWSAQQVPTVFLLALFVYSWVTAAPSEGACKFLQVLNLLLFKLTKRQYDENLLMFLFVDEHLVDIGDDLVDYEV